MTKIDTYRITGDIARVIGGQTTDDSDALYASILRVFARSGLQVKPTRRPTDAELAAIEGIRRAYLACNATDADGTSSALAWEVSPGHSVKATAMGHLAEAARKAWDALGLPGDYLWDLQQDSGEDATYVYEYWAREVGLV